MLENSATKFCMAACIFMILISLSMNVVTGLNVFGTNTPSPTINQSMTNISKIASGNIFSLIGENIASILTGGILVGGGLLLVVALAGRTGSWNIVAVYLFGMVFWGSWVVNLSLFGYGGYLNTPVLSSVLLMITVGMVFIFAGATIGILGGTD